jgi:hypothetical protein
MKPPVFILLLLGLGLIAKEITSGQEISLRGNRVKASDLDRYRLQVDLNALKHVSRPRRRGEEPSIAPFIRGPVMRSWFTQPPTTALQAILGMVLWEDSRRDAAHDGREVPCSIRKIARAAGVSRNAIRRNLTILEQEGKIRLHRATGKKFWVELLGHRPDRPRDRG